jgi:hypothetical protein
MIGLVPVQAKEEEMKMPTHNELSDEKAVPVEFRTKLVTALSIAELCKQIETFLNKHSIYFTNKRGVLYKCKYTVCHVLCLSFSILFSPVKCEMR